MTRQHPATGQTPQTGQRPARGHEPAAGWQAAMRRRRAGGAGRAVAVCVSVWAAVSVGLSGSAAGQRGTAVFLDDSPAAEAALAKIGELLERGSLGEAVRALDATLRSDGDKLVASAGDPGLFVSVRDAVHSALRSDERLLGAYRELVSPEAMAALERGEVARVEREMLLTPAGYAAVLRLTQVAVEEGRFGDAARMLEQVIAHPDTDASAVRLAELVAGYLRVPGVSALGVIEAERLVRGVRSAVEGEAGAVEGGRAGPGEAVVIARPPGLLEAADRFEGAVVTGSWRVEQTSIASTPVLWALWAEAERQELLDQVGQVDDVGLAEPTAPTVAGDSVLMNWGTVLASYDRYSLEEQWRWDAALVAAPTTARRFELDAAAGGAERRVLAVSAGSDVVAALMGSPVSGSAWSRSLHVLDRRTGELLWTRSASELGVEGTAVFFGQPRVVDGTVVVALRSTAVRRLQNSWVAGLEAMTGRVLWRRLVAAVGEQTLFQATVLNEGLAGGAGMVYRTDQLGAVAGIETGTGRVRWLRWVDEPSSLGAQSPAWPVRVPSVEADGAAVVTLSPQGSEVLRLEALSGRVLARRRPPEQGRVWDLIVVPTTGGPVAAVVRDQSLGLVRTAELAGGAWGQVQLPSRVVGRPVVAGSLALVPVASGLAVVDVERAMREAEGRSGSVSLLEVGRTGEIGAAEGQVLIADGRGLHSYVSWDVASAGLEARLSGGAGGGEPDAGPAISLARLASRSGRWDELIGLVRRASEVLGTMREGPERRAQAARYGLLLGEVAGAAPGGWSGPGVRLGGGRGAVATIESGPVRDRVLAVVLDELGRMATSGDERLAHAAASGWWAEARGDLAGARAAFAAVLDDAEGLARAEWQGRGLRVSGGVLARTELRRLAAVEAGGEGGTDAGAEALARAARAQGNIAAGLREWREAARHGAAAGHAGLAGALAEAGLVREAAAAGAQGGADGGGPGAFVPAVAVGSGFAAPDELPAIRGTLVRSLVAGVDGVPGGALVFDAAGSSLALVAREAGAAVEGRAGAPAAGMTAVWSQEVEAEPGLLGTTENGLALVLLPDGDVGQTAVVAGLELSTGQTRWRSAVLHGGAVSVFGEEAAGEGGVDNGVGAGGQAFEAASGLGAVLVAVDGRRVVLARRGGQVVCLDAATGERAWTGRASGLGAVEHAALGGRVLVVAGPSGGRAGGPSGGRAAQAVGRAMEDAARSTFAAIDARAEAPTGSGDGAASGGAWGVRAIDAATGEPLGPVAMVSEAPAWVVTVEGHVAVAGGPSVEAVDLVTGERLWRLEADGWRAEAAWALGSRVLVLARARQASGGDTPTAELWLIDAGTGRWASAASGPLETAGRLDDGAPVAVRWLGPDRFAVLTTSGALHYAADGRLVARDITSQPAAGLTVFAGERSASVAGAKLNLAESDTVVCLTDVATGRLLDAISVDAPEGISSVVAIDGAVLVTTGGSTAVLLTK